MTEIKGISGNSQINQTLNVNENTSSPHTDIARGINPPIEVAYNDIGIHQTAGNFSTMLNDISNIIPEMWAAYKDVKIIKIDQDTWRPVADDDQTYSETVSYVLRRARTLGDKETFTKVWKWAYENMIRKNVADIYSANSIQRTPSEERLNNLMCWRYLGENSSFRKANGLPVGITFFDWTEADKNLPWVDGFDAAPDADVLIAYELLQADKIWGSTGGYLDFKGIAKQIISDVWETSMIIQPINNSVVPITFDRGKIWDNNPNARTELLENGGIKINFGNTESWGGIAGIHSLGLNNINDYDNLVLNFGANTDNTYFKIIFQTPEGPDRKEYGIEIKAQPNGEVTIPISKLVERINYNFVGGSIPAGTILHNFAIQGSNGTKIEISGVSLQKETASNEPVETRYILSANDKKTNVVNLSYAMPFALKAFAEVDPNHDWLAAYNYAYDNLNDSLQGDYPDAKNPTGIYQGGVLVPDWSKVNPDGTLSSAYGTWESFAISDVQDTHISSWDAFRVYIWAAEDYIQNNNPEAKDFLIKAASFFADELDNNGWIFNAYAVDGTLLDAERRGSQDKGHPLGMATALAIFCALDDKENASKVFELLKEQYHDGHFTPNEDDYFVSNLLAFSLDLFQTKYGQ
ncbi:MAG: hypothetical protein V1843_00360 [bacterium]